MTINKKQIAYNRTARTQKPQYIVIHDTGNTGKGSNADAHFTYFNGGDRQASYDFVVDDKQILQVNDYTKYYSWHCGDGKGAYGITNGNSVGIEICINSDGDYNAAWNKTVELTRWLMAELGVPAERVVRHYDASRKNCPASMSGSGWAKWNEFKAAITKTAAAPTPPPDNTPSEWAKTAWEWAKGAGITDGTNPQGAITREQAAAMLHRFAVRAGLL